MSQSVGSPFMCDTMLRSGVPPHIGQSPEPGSDANTREWWVAPANTSTRPIVTLLNHNHKDHEDHEDHKDHEDHEPNPNRRFPISATFVIFVIFVVVIFVVAI